MMPQDNLRKPSSGDPVAIPSTKEMALGNYYLTSIDSQIAPRESAFATTEEAIFAYHSKNIKLRQEISVDMNGVIVKTSVGRLLFNEVLPIELRFVNEAVKRSVVVSLFNKAFTLLDKTRIAQMIDDLKNLGFWAGTISGISVSITDCELYVGRDEAIAEVDAKVAEINSNFEMGLITLEEKKRLSQSLWLDATESIADKTWSLYSIGNPIRLMVDAQVGRISREQVKQLSGIRGLVVDPTGRIVDLPIKSNYRIGFSTFEYVSATRGERKGLSDTAIRTADAGYLTRRLVDVSHDALIRMEDCKTTDGITISRSGSRGKAFALRVFGRVLAQDVKLENKVLIKAGEVIDDTKKALLEKEKVSEVVVRSTLMCKAKYGLCATCYGWNLSTMSMAVVGDPMGVIAAQSIGEPGTQMTLHGKRGALTAGSIDVTQGLPRVEELFEARTPKVVSPLAEISGNVEITETDEGYKIRVRNTTVKPVEEREYIIPLTSQLNVSEGELVAAGTQLAGGSLDIKDVLEVRGLRGAQEYLIEEIQLVYESQGVGIHDKHFETIVRKMSDKVRVLTQGDTTILPGDILDRAGFEEENSRVLAAGGEPATAQVVILGITRSALKTASWLSAASFIETTSQLAEAAVEGKIDRLLGLKENVIIGRLIPTSPERAFYANN